MTVDPGSFRDPSGRVFTRDGNIYRSIFEPGVADYEAARDAGVYEKLAGAGLLITHEEVRPDWPTPEGTVYCLSHPRLPMVSYPWEWSFSMLKDAALLHLDAMEMLVPMGFWLRDASAFNVQYDGEGLRIIDTLSIGRRAAERPWVGYGQFCSHFLAPLSMAAYCDFRMFALWRSFIDGIPLDLAAKTLPFTRRYRPGLFVHLTLHSRFQEAADKKEDIQQGKPAKRPKVSDRGLIGLIRSLRRTIQGIEWKRSSKIWEDYGAIRTYSAEDVTEKAGFVEKAVRSLRPGTVWDLGANTGEFSLIAASEGAFVVGIDGDGACTENLYRRLAGERWSKKVLPLTMDLANPSPGLGWDGRERLSLSGRAPADLVMALALVHHLVLSNCIPLSIIAEWLRGLARHLLVEFVPPGDPMVEKLLRNRDEHLPYSLEAFKSSFGEVFDFEDRLTLKNGRELYLCKQREL